MGEALKASAISHSSCRRCGQDRGTCPPLQIGRNSPWRLAITRWCYLGRHRKNDCDANNGRQSAQASYDPGMISLRENGAGLIDKLMDDDGRTLADVLLDG
jgi:hypothetical protein